MNEEVLLAPPGAGLSLLELWVSRAVLGVLRKILSRHQIEGWLRIETGKVLTIGRKLSPEQMKRQVLIPKPIGLEDSSRNWSAAMVLQHLVIVDTGIGEVIAALAQNQTLRREIRIADVKPGTDSGQEQLERLEEALGTYIDRLAAIEDLHTASRHAHPWFGPLDGHGWYTLAALHTMIHRRQLCAITKICEKRP